MLREPRGILQKRHPFADCRQSDLDLSMTKFGTLKLIFYQCVSLDLYISPLKVVPNLCPFVQRSSLWKQPVFLITDLAPHLICSPSLTCGFLTVVLFQPCFVTFALCSFCSDSTFIGSHEYHLSWAPGIQFLSLKVGLGFLGQTKMVSTNYFVSKSVSRYSQ